MAELIGVGTNHSFEVCWQSPDLPAPTILTAPAKPGGLAGSCSPMMTGMRESDDGC